MVHLPATAGFGSGTRQRRLTFSKTEKVSLHQRAYAARPIDGKPPQVLLRADGALGYARVMRVMGELNRAGLNRVSLVVAATDAP